MYPKLSDLINDLLGTNINLPIQSYGFFLALAFLTGAVLLYFELDRKEKEGLLLPQKKKVTKGKPASAFDLSIFFIVSTFIGWKLTGFIFNYSTFVDNPQEYIFSGQGSWIGGVVFGAVVTAWYFYNRKKQTLEKPVVEEVLVHPKEHAWPILFIAVIGGIVGAKLFHWFENWDEFISDPIGSLISFSGLTFYGGLIVAFAASIYYGHRNKIKVTYLIDAVAPSLILAYGIGRIGCQVAGDGDWGIVNAAPKPSWLNFLPDWMWSFTFPHNIINEGVPIPGCTGPHCFELPVGVYPTAFYETVMAFIIFGILWGLRKHLKIHGLLFSIYLMFNGTERFLIEKIRINNVFDFLGLKVTQAEIISSLIFLAGLLLFFFFLYTSDRQKT